MRTPYVASNNFAYRASVDVLTEESLLFVSLWFVVVCVCVPFYFRLVLLLFYFVKIQIGAPVLRHTHAHVFVHIFSMIPPLSLSLSLSRYSQFLLDYTFAAPYAKWG